MKDENNYIQELNEAHLNGFINRAHVSNPIKGQDLRSISIDVATIESYIDKNDPTTMVLLENGEEKYVSKQIRTYTPVQFYTDDKAEIEKYLQIEKDCKNNMDILAKKVKGKQITHRIVLDGAVSSKTVERSEKGRKVVSGETYENNLTYINTVIRTTPDKIKVDDEITPELARTGHNSVRIAGPISIIAPLTKEDEVTGFRVSIATHRTYPATDIKPEDIEEVNGRRKIDDNKEIITVLRNDEKVDLVRETNYHNAIVNKGKKSEKTNALFEGLSNGTITVGGILDVGGKLRQDGKTVRKSKDGEKTYNTATLMVKFFNDYRPAKAKTETQAQSEKKENKPRKKTMRQI